MKHAEQRRMSGKMEEGGEEDDEYDEDEDE